ncbi:MAG: hypothetical protein E7399_05080 [Ruminococcaceae bacterium]|nr:hypothetical protein [Oscillospiraceae bacterium]
MVERQKQWLIIGLVTMVWLSGCTINITRNVTEPPNREALSTEIPTPPPAWETETAPITGENAGSIRAKVHLTNVEEYVVHTVRSIYYDVMGDSSLGSSSRNGKTWYYRGDFVVR